MKPSRPSLLPLIKEFAPYFKGLGSKLIFVFTIMDLVVLIAVLPVLTALSPKVIPKKRMSL